MSWFPVLDAIHAMKTAVYVKGCGAEPTVVRMSKLVHELLVEELRRHQFTTSTKPAGNVTTVYGLRVEVAEFANPLAANLSVS